MTLREKLEVEIMDLPIMSEVVEDIAKNLEHVADDFAIGFVLWMSKNQFSLDTYDNKGDIKDLLLIYKKETGL